MPGQGCGPLQEACRSDPARLAQGGGPALSLGRGCHAAIVGHMQHHPVDPTDPTEARRPMADAPDERPAPRDPAAGRLRIALVAPPAEAVPPIAYGGTERIVYELAVELDRRGHAVTVFASGDSDVPCELITTVPRALRGSGHHGDASGFVLATIAEVLRRASAFDVIHGHLDFAGVLLAHASPTPTVGTFHGRLDRPFAGAILADAPFGLVAISRNQASMHPEVPWAGIVHNGLTLDGAPFQTERDDSLVFVGRICEEKGVVDAIEVARLTGRRLRIAAKIGPSAAEQAYAESVFEPALERADAEYLGELSGPDRDRLVAESHALIMPGAWPEPFGLVAIEALACGTPVIGRRVGALPEIVRQGVDGFLADDAAQMAFLVERVAELDRAAIRADVIDRFSAGRMVDGYEEVYARVLSGGTAPDRGPGYEHGPIAAAESMAAPEPIRA
jgi:glycosyltransferase involved in cell wall biosynthesis